jgi:hypothetical protein
MIEFRLYHNNGKFICYSCEELDGEYVIIDAETYALGNPYVQVLEGKIEPLSFGIELYKLTKSKKGTMCPIEDIAIVVDKSYKGKTNKYSYEQIKD